MEIDTLCNYVAAAVESAVGDWGETNTIDV